MIDTQVARTSGDEPSSVIHAPPGFKQFDEGRSNTQSPTESSENTVVSPETPEATPRSPADKVYCLRPKAHDASRLTAAEDGVARQY
jgi:hypothetical protein